LRVIKLVLEYDGADFSGWQVQPGMRTVQGELEGALLRLTGEQTRVTAAGRTDAGVHARGQVASFSTGSRHEAVTFYKGLNALLPADVAVLSAEDAGSGFDARRDAKLKTYRYLIRDGGPRPALERRRVWHIHERLDLRAVSDGAAFLVGEHDFSSFRCAGSDAKTSVRDMKRIEVYRDGEGRAVIEFSATGFLKQMARSMAGTLADAGRGRMAAGEVKDILDSRDRDRAGATAPPHGLYLVNVYY